MGAKMTFEEKSERSEARILGGWTRSAIMHAQLHQHEADAWRETFPEHASESARVWEAKADRAQKDAVEYARKAARHAIRAIEAHEQQAQLRAFVQHRAADPHCTCNDCSDYHFSQQRSGEGSNEP